jgi:uncharacterized protein YecT (DUF1311 family)
VIWLALLYAPDWQPPPCGDTGPNSTTRCARRDLARAERAIAAAFGQARGWLRSCRPRDSTQCYDLEHGLRLFEAEQRTWRAWRDAHCDVVAFEVEGSSAEAMVRMDCRTGLTVKRTKELQQVGRR